MKRAINLLAIISTLAFGNTALAGKTYKSTSVIQINPSEFAILPNANGLPDFTADYMEIEMKSVTSPEVLRAALKLMEPDSEADDNALAEVRKKISVNPRRGTDFVEITVKDPDPTKAVGLADAIANTFVQQRNEREKARALAALEALDDELTLQNEQVQKSRVELTALIQKYGIPYFDGREEKAPKPQSHQEAIESIKAASPRDKAGIAASVEFPGNPVTPLYQNYVQALVELDHLGMAYRAKHPKMIKAKQNVAQARKAASAAVPELIDLLQKSETEKDTVELNLQQQTYNEAKEDYEQSRDMFREMKIKQQEARVLLKMPRTPVTIHERAK